jgi:hypothetical protein
VQCDWVWPKEKCASKISFIIPDAKNKTPTSKPGGRGFSVAFSKSAQQISTPLLNGLPAGSFFQFSNEP